MINVGSRNGQVEITSTASRQTLNKIQAWLLVSRIMGTLAGLSKDDMSNADCAERKEGEE